MQRDKAGELDGICLPRKNTIVSFLAKCTFEICNVCAILGEAIYAQISSIVILIYEVGALDQLFFITADHVKRHLLAF